MLSAGGLIAFILLVLLGPNILTRPVWPYDSHAHALRVIDIGRRLAVWRLLAAAVAVGMHASMLQEIAPATRFAGYVPSVVPISDVFVKPYCGQRGQSGCDGSTIGTNPIHRLRQLHRGLNGAFPLLPSCRKSRIILFWDSLSLNDDSKRGSEIVYM
jgi:hypothetical protein